MNQDIEFMKVAYQEAKKAYEIDEVPVGAIVVRNNEIIARAYNQREKQQVVTCHAETMAIEEACRKLKSWRLDDCVLYTTLEPCVMCSGVIINSRIKKVVYGARDTRWMSFAQLMDKEQCSFNHHPIVVSGILEDECSKLIKEYFKNKRKVA